MDTIRSCFLAHMAGEKQDVAKCIPQQADLLENAISIYINKTGQIGGTGANQASQLL